MGKAEQTRDNLVAEARLLFWRKGYANVGLRQIARAAGVDVALISRYFGGKRGLFEATLAGAFELEGLLEDPDPVERIARAISVPVVAGNLPDPLRLLVMNGADEEVGAAVRAAFATGFLDRFRDRLTGPDITERSALFAAALLGAIVARKILALPGMAGASEAQLLRQNRHLLHAALAYRAG